MFCRDHPFEKSVVSALLDIPIIHAYLPNLRSEILTPTSMIAITSSALTTKDSKFYFKQRGESEIDVDEACLQEIVAPKMPKPLVTV